MSDRMNVLLLNDSFPPQIDGVANAVVNYASLLPKHGCSATVAVPYYPEADDTRFPFPVVRYPSLDTTSLVGYRAGLPFAPETLAELRRGEFTVLHSHCPIASTLLARTLRSKTAAPLILTYHTKFDIDISNAIHGKLLQEGAIRLLIENVSACDEVWGVSRGALENLRSLGYAGECRVMQNGVDLPRGRASEEAIREATAGFDLPEGVPVFLFVGRMMWYKGLRLLLDALRSLCEAGQDFRMVMIGEGGELAEIREYEASLSLGGRCIFTGAIRERETLRAWYSRADLFLFPSTFDTNGLVVREAAACGLASVLIRGSCAAEDVTDGQNAFLIGETSGDMARLLLALCRDRETMRRVGLAAGQELYLSWDEAVGNALHRYELVAENHARGVYPQKKDVTEELLRGIADVLAAVNEAKERGEIAGAELALIRRERRERIADKAQELRESGEELHTKLEEGVKRVIGETELRKNRRDR